MAATTSIAYQAQLPQGIQVITAAFVALQAGPSLPDVPEKSSDME